MVPPAEFTSYYGKPILNPPVWAARDIAGYFFLGGLAGGSSLLATGADLTGRPALSRAAKAGYPAERVSLIDLLDRVLAGGVVVTGEITLSIADVDLVVISLRALLCSVSSLVEPETEDDR